MDYQNAIEDIAYDQGWSDKTLHKMAYEMLVKDEAMAKRFLEACKELQQEEKKLISSFCDDDDDFEDEEDFDDER
jgi:hypothetical protein